MKLAIVGATGMVGREILAVLAERNFAISELIPVASKKSCGQTISYFSFFQFPLILGSFLFHTSNTLGTIM